MQYIDVSMKTQNKYSSAFHFPYGFPMQYIDVLMKTQNKYSSVGILSAIERKEKVEKYLNKKKNRS